MFDWRVAIRAKLSREINPVEAKALGSEVGVTFFIIPNLEHARCGMGYEAVNSGCAGCGNGALLNLPLVACNFNKND
jgi:hypothetical protein